MKIKSEVTFPGELKEEPIICNICKKFDVVLSIVEASFSTDTGWAILIMESEADVLKNIFLYLNEKGVKIEDVEEVT